MRLRWSFFAGKDISATPAVADGRVYFPSWNGYLYAVNAFTGRLIWQPNLGALTGLEGTGVVVNVTVSRSMYFSILQRMLCWVVALARRVTSDIMLQFPG